MDTSKTKFLKFEINDIDFIEEQNESQFATAKILAFSSGVNRHDLTCDEETLKRTASSLYNKPILYSIDKEFNDFYTHVLPENARICGFIIPGSAEFIRLDDSRLGLYVLAKIWKRYSQKVIHLFERDHAYKKVSVEMEAFDLQPMEDGLTNMVSFAYTGVCILGDFITEASPGANIEILSFTQEKELFEKACEEEFSHELPKKRWAEKTRKKLNLGINISFPYKSIAEINPALKDIEPPITLGQANQIAKQADTLGRDSEKNGWAIAISSFKKAHIVEDEKWVKKSSQDMSFDKNPEIKDKEVTIVDKEEMAVDTAKQEEKETLPEEKKETSVEQKEEEKKGVEKKFEFPKNFNIDVMQAMFSEEEDEEEIKMAKSEFCKGNFADPSVVMAGMFAKMCKMSSKLEKMAENEKTYMGEIEQLKKFKADVETSQKNFAIEKILQELSEKVIIPDDAKKEMISEAEKYSFSDLKTWETYCKAKSFDFAVRDQAKSDVVKIGLPFSGSQKKNDELWS